MYIISFERAVSRGCRIIPGTARKGRPPGGGMTVLF
jgi:hypothetical protein